MNPITTLLGGMNGNAVYAVYLYMLHDMTSMAYSCCHLTVCSHPYTSAVDLSTDSLQHHKSYHVDVGLNTK